MQTFLSNAKPSPFVIAGRAPLLSEWGKKQGITSFVDGSERDPQPHAVDPPALLASLEHGSSCLKRREEQGSPNRWESVWFNRLPVNPVRHDSGLDRYQTGPNSKFKFKFKKMKNSQKIPKNTSRCDESNGVNFFQKFVHLV